MMGDRKLRDQLASATRELETAHADLHEANAGINRLNVKLAELTAERDRWKSRAEAGERIAADMLRTAGVEALMRTRPKIATDIARLTAINEPATWLDGTIVGGTGSGGSVKLTGGGSADAFGNGAQYPAE
jgi:chromosome segregation ATPase